MFTDLKKLLAFLFVAGLFIFTVNAQKRFSEIRSVPPAEFKILLETRSDIILIDVRNVRDFQKEHLEKSLCASTAKQVKKILEAEDRERYVLLYSEQDFDSLDMAPIVSDMGFLNVVILAGGLELWKEAGYKTVATD